MPASSLAALRRPVSGRRTRGGDRISDASAGQGNCAGRSGGYRLFWRSCSCKGYVKRCPRPQERPATEIPKRLARATAAMARRKGGKVVGSDRVRSRSADSLPRIPHRRHRRRLHHGRRPSRQLRRRRAFRSSPSPRARRPGQREVAERWGIPKIHATPQALIEDANVEILDIAFPPDQQPDLIRHALRQNHIKAILAQKPLALDFATSQNAGRRSEGCRQSDVGQPEHALRSVDARPEANS